MMPSTAYSVPTPTAVIVANNKGLHQQQQSKPHVCIPCWVWKWAFIKLFNIKRLRTEEEITSRKNNDYIEKEARNWRESGQSWTLRQSIISSWGWRNYVAWVRPSSRSRPAVSGSGMGQQNPQRMWPPEGQPPMCSAPLHLWLGTNTQSH